MILVTGYMRTGTSLMMQTLMHLGFPIAGEAFPDGNPEECNPEGYWELPISETVNGIKDDRYHGKAVKLFADSILGTRNSCVDRIILCTRNKKETIHNIMRFFFVSNFDIAPTRSNAEKIYDHNKQIIDAYLKICRKPILKVKLSKFIYDTDKTIDDIIEFVNLPKDVDKTKALANIRRD